MDKKYLVLLVGAELLAAAMLGLTAASPGVETFGQTLYEGGDVVSDKAHAVDAPIDVAHGRLEGVPVFDRRSRRTGRDTHASPPA